MNIVAMSVDYFPNLGGISSMAHHMSNAFARLGHDVRFIAPRNATSESEYCREYRLVVDEQSDARLRETRKYSTEMRRIERLLGGEHQRSHIDRIVLFHPFYYGLPAVRFGRAHAIPTSCYIHGFELRSQLLKHATIAERLGMQSLSYRDLRHSTIQIIREVDECLANSTVTAELVRQAGRQDVTVTGCGIDETDLRAQLIRSHEKPVQRAQARSRLGLPDDKRILGFLGRLVPSKNVGFLIETISHLPDDYMLTVVGPGDCQILHEAAIANGVAHRVQFLGPVPESLKWDVLAALDLLCLPSVSLPTGEIEGFGIVLLEATVKSTPVAVSTIGGMRDFVLDHNGIYLDVTDPIASAHLVHKTLDNHALVLRMTNNAQRLMEEQLTYDQICRRLVGDWLSST